MKKILLPLTLLMLWQATILAQNRYTISNRRAIGHFEQADRFYSRRQNKLALLELDKALRFNNRFIEAWLFKADVLHALRRTDEEIQAYQKAIEINPTFFPNVHFNLANVYFKTGKYLKAKEKYKDFLSYPKISDRNKKLSNKKLVNCDFAIEKMQHPVDFDPVNLGEGVNSSADEYWPTLTADEEILIFTRLDYPAKEVKLKKQEDFWVSVRKDTVWQPAKYLSVDVNTHRNEGAQTITADGRYMYFTACNRSDGYGKCDIYYAFKQGGEWSKPMNIGKPINSAAWDSQPSVSADGRVLYFVSNRKSGKGMMDIWQSKLIETLEDGSQRWSQPQNLPINTVNNEMSPFIHAGNSYLVFASDGRVGMGGYDLYKMEKNEQNQWTKPENLGYPINTHGDEIGLVINARGDKAYFSSNRVAKNGRDIFSFDLPKELQPPTTSWLKGKVFDAETKKRLWASLLLIDLERKDTIAQLKSDRVNGNYLLCLPSGREYMFAAEADGYLFYSNHFSMLGDKKKTDPQVLDIPLYALKKGSEINLRNIFFAVDSWELLPQSELELQRLTRLLSVNSTLIVEIGGHTDSTGDDAHNLNLSNNRAKAVCDYLIKNGIAKKRLTYKGYGENKPIADNESEKGKALNRRTGFKILDH